MTLDLFEVPLDGVLNNHQLNIIEMNYLTSCKPWEKEPQQPLGYFQRDRPGEGYY
jgi:hypothetical protein